MLTEYQFISWKWNIRYFDTFRFIPILLILDENLRAETLYLFVAVIYTKLFEAIVYCVEAFCVEKYVYNETQIKL